MPDRKIAITGLGVVCPAGLDAEEVFNNLLEGKQFVKKVEGFDAGGFTANFGGEIMDFSARKFVPKSYRKAVKVMARDIEIAVAASDLAFRDAGIVTKSLAESGDAETNIDSKRLGCNIGAGLICAELDELALAATSSTTDDTFDIKKWGEHGMTNLTPLWLLKYLPNMLSCHVTIIHGAEGPSNNITCGDASGPLSVGESAMYIKRGTCDAVVTGSAESKLNPMGFMRQAKLGRIIEKSCDNPADAVRPFDAEHAGLAISEGGALLILEDMQRAQGRNAKVYAEVAGFGASCDPRGIEFTRATAGNLGLAVKSALADAGITVDDVDAIFTYGTGVPAEDTAEAAEWKKVFGDKLKDIPAVASTGMTGTLFAGGGALQVALAAKCVEKQVVPPTVNFKTAAEGVELNLSDKPRPTNIKYLVAGCYTVGGQSGAVVLKSVEK